MRRCAARQALRLFLVLAASLLLASIPASAIDTLHLEIAKAEGAGWTAHGIAVDIAWQATHQAAVTVSATHLQLPPPLGRLSGLSLYCATATLSNETTYCAAGVLNAQGPLFDRPRMQVAFTYHHADASLELELHEVYVAGGVLQVAARLGSATWQTHIQAKKLDITKLPASLAGLVKWPSDVKAQGVLTVAAHLSGSPDTLQEVQLDGDVSSLDFASGGGQQASEKLAADFTLNAQAHAGRWRFQTQAHARQGQLYLEPVFIEFPRTGLKLNARGEWDRAKQTVAVTQLSVDHPGIGQAKASLTLKLKPFELESAAFKTTQAALQPLYSTYLQPFALDTAFDALALEGHIDLELNYQAQALSMLRVGMDNVSLTDEQGRYAFAGLNGDLAWTRGAQALHSDIRWLSGRVYQVPLGASRLALRSAHANLELREPFSLPLLDGSLEVEQLAIAQVAQPAMAITLSGALTPVSMGALSKALGWPAMTGKLSGIIPAVTYRQETIAIGGALLVQAFDGTIVVRNLRLERPFGRVPALFADIDIDNLDLDTLTRTFSFGKIQGRLDGKVYDLRMEDWQPVAFNAQLATPPDDSSRQRISQQAVNSLSSLGGASGVLSRSFLRFFDEFSYQRLGIGCRLRAGVCEMGGVEPAKNGYYIVKGGGIPRIDVLGFATRVDWKVLVERLKNATQSEGPIVQ